MAALFIGELRRITYRATQRGSRSERGLQERSVWTSRALTKIHLVSQFSSG
jgi:hypothetical protein